MMITTHHAAVPALEAGVAGVAVGGDVEGTAQEECYPNLMMIRLDAILIR